MIKTKSVFTQPSIPTFEPYVDEHVIANFLHLEPRRVLEMARKNLLPAHPIGNIRKTWRFRVSEIESPLQPEDEAQAQCYDDPGSSRHSGRQRT